MANTKEFYFLMKSDNTQPVFENAFLACEEVVKYTRRYLKLPEILGSLDGTIHFVKIFCTLLSKKLKLATNVSKLNYITKKLYFVSNLEKLKMLLLDKDQLALFKYLSKPL